MTAKEIIYDWGGANVALFHLMNGGTGNGYYHLMLIGTTIGKYTMFPLYLAVLLAATIAYGRKLRSARPEAWAAYRNRWAEAYAVLIASYLLGVLWIGPLKRYLHYPRPYVALPEGSVNITEHMRQAELPMTSFPSGHTEFATVMVVSLWPALNGTGRILAAFYLIGVAASRMALGVHFPADIAGTFAISFCVVTLVRFGVRRIRRHKIFAPSAISQI